MSLQSGADTPEGGFRRVEPPYSRKINLTDHTFPSPLIFDSKISICTFFKLFFRKKLFVFMWTHHFCCGDDRILKPEKSVIRRHLEISCTV